MSRLSSPSFQPNPSPTNLQQAMQSGLGSYAAWIFRGEADVMQQRERVQELFPNLPREDIAIALSQIGHSYRESRRLQDIGRLPGRFSGMIQDSSLPENSNYAYNVLVRVEGTVAYPGGLNLPLRRAYHSTIYSSRELTLQELQEELTREAKERIKQGTDTTPALNLPSDLSIAIFVQSALYR